MVSNANRARSFAVLLAAMTMTVPSPAAVKLDLAGSWSLTGSNALHRPIACPISVPGDTYAALLAAGEIPDPYWGANETNVQWVGLHDWTIARTFQVPAGLLAHKSVILRLEDCDTFCTVKINGHVVGRATDRFQRFEFDVKPFLKAGENRIEGLFESAERIGHECRARSARPYPLNGVPWATDHAFVRKPACHAGWDWGPALMYAGFCGTVALIASDRPRVDYVYSTQEFNADYSHCTLTVFADLSDGTTVTNKLEIDNPPLWWPNGMGEQKFYTYDVEVGGERLRRRIGLRKIEVLNEKSRMDDGKEGLSMTFRVNGRKLFAKGANWIPADAMASRQTPARYRNLLTSAAAANMNMIRLWGGGQYECDFFYDLCDELGLLVWHDMMHACAAYPANDAFLAELGKELAHQLRRLRDHASIALWCGDNECLGAIGWFAETARNAPFYRGEWVKRSKFQGVMVRTYDPTRTYWPTSPCCGPDDFGDAWKEDSRGDMHNWDVWHGNKPFDEYYRFRPRFCSEFGYQSFPSMEIAETFATRAEIVAHAPGFEWHQKNKGGNRKIRDTMARYFPPPKDVEAELLMSQFQHGMAMKMAVDGWRAQRPRCMGTLYWQLNDVWPVASWSSIEYGGKWKPLHHMARRFYAPLSVVAQPCVAAAVKAEEKAAVDVTRGKVIALNDTAASVAGALTVEYWTYDGKIVSAETKSVVLPPDSVTEVADFDRRVAGDRQKDAFLVLTLKTKSVICQNDWHFGFYRDMPLAGAQVKARVDDERRKVVLSTDKPAFFVWANVRNARGEFDDNCFTLLPGRDRTLTFSGTIPSDRLTVSHLTAISTAEDMAARAIPSGQHTWFALDECEKKSFSTALAPVPRPREMKIRQGAIVDPKIVETHDGSLPAEGYRLSVTEKGVAICAATAAGFAYGRTTLDQLAVKIGDSTAYPFVEINDAPAFAWRGVHFDDCRHFFGKNAVKRVLDQMAEHKLNVFHWHLTDDQGWRLEIPGYPDLIRYGAVRSASPRRGICPRGSGEPTYFPEDMDGVRYGPYYYTEKDVREILAYAAERHITVVPEIELPGHAFAAIAAYPELACFPENAKARDPRLAWGVSSDVICLGNDKAIKFYEDVLDYVCRLFPSKIIHIGGDECPSVRWAKCPKCQARMKAEGLKDVKELQPWATRHFVDFLAKRGKRAIGWDEYINETTPASAIGMNWHVRAPVAGHDTVMAPEPNAYLDSAQALPDDPFQYYGRHTLEDCFNLDPCKGVAASERHHVLGGQCCNWSEYTWNETELDWKMWPRACATAEALWLGEAKPRYRDFLERVRIHRRRLLLHHVNCAPIAE